MALEIVRLDPLHDRSLFRSGNPELDRFFLLYAGQNQFRHHIGVTYVAILDGAVVGYATVTPSEIHPLRLKVVKGKRLPKYPIPVLRLARLAVDERLQGHGVGSSLLRAVFAIAVQLADEVGCAGILVDAKTDAVAFYEKLGFIALAVEAGELGDRPIPLVMFLELDQLR